MLVIIAAAAIVFCVVITRDGKLIIPRGIGIVALDVGEFEAFPLPDYAAKHLTDGYKSYFVEVEPGIKVHVIEIGSGLPVFLLHGNPTSGFLYRKVVAQLPTDRLRLIMPTLVGLGFSTKIPASRHTLENHIRWMNSVLLKLKMTQLVYVGQDWGGPVGMGALALSPDLLKGAVLLNTGFNALKRKMDISRAHAAAKTPIAGELILEVFSSTFERLHRVQNDPNSISADVVELYGRPVLESGNGKAPLAMMRMYPDGPDHPSTAAMRIIERYVQALDIPAEIVWGMNDPILGKGLSAMQNNFPQAPVTKTQAGHFLQEEVPGEIAAAIMRVINHIQSTGN